MESADSSFTVRDIKVEGLQRISEGTVFNYLPVNIGDHLTPQRVREAIRALYATGFFRDVELRREGNTLIVVVLERPSIESFTISGNKDIKTDELQKSLRNIGLAPGKIFDRSVLDDVTQSLTDEYYSRGKYGVEIDNTVTADTDNRVKIAIKIREGDRAVIRSINIVGDTKFKQKDVLQSFQLKTPNWLSWYKQDDRYSRETLQGDLERLRDYYMDRGYANFQINSTQVQITPEKNDIFIDVNITEGQVYKISTVKLAGIFVVPKPELEQLVEIQPGEIFNRKLITATQKLIQDRLGEDGYAFAKVDPVPTPDDTNHTVALTFFIDPGNRVYVRNIIFSNETSINDVVLRREMRQLEGAWLSNVALERSKQRIQRLPYVKDVSYSTTPVAGSPDQVDVNYKITQGPAAQLSGGIGYSATYKLMLNANYADADFLGTRQPLRGRSLGRRLQQDLQRLVHEPVDHRERDRADAVGDLQRRHAVRLLVVELLLEDAEPRAHLELSDLRVPVPGVRHGLSELAAPHHLLQQRPAGERVGAGERPLLHPPGARGLHQQRLRALRHRLQQRAVRRRLGHRLAQSLAVRRPGQPHGDQRPHHRTRGRGAVLHGELHLPAVRAALAEPPHAVVIRRRRLRRGAREDDGHSALLSRSSAAARTRCAASARTGSARATTSATPTAATSASPARTSSSCRCRPSGSRVPG